MRGTGLTYKIRIPWFIAGSRALLGPVIIAGQRASWNGAALAAMVVAALLSDIFDGVLARRWKCDTASVRLFDSMADMVFYLGVGTALWLRHPGLARSLAAPFCTLIAVEAVRMTFESAKYGKPASYHSALAKTWGLTLATAAVLGFTSTGGLALRVSWLAACLLGILCNIEGLVMSLLLPAWQRDVLSIRCAIRLRAVLTQPVAPPLDENPRSHLGRTQPSPTLSKVVALLTLGLTLGIARAEPIHPVVLAATSIATTASSSEGTLDTSAGDALVFRAPRNPELRIAYAQVQDFSFQRENRHPLGVLATIAVGLIAARQHRYLVTIEYRDMAGARQTAIFDLPRDGGTLLLSLLRQRTSLCDPKAISACTGQFSPSAF